MLSHVPHARRSKGGTASRKACGGRDFWPKNPSSPAAITLERLQATQSARRDWIRHAVTPNHTHLCSRSLLPPCQYHSSPCQDPSITAHFGRFHSEKQLCGLHFSAEKKHELQNKVNINHPAHGSCWAVLAQCGARARLRRGCWRCSLCV